MLASCVINTHISLWKIFRCIVFRDPWWRHIQKFTTLCIIISIRKAHAKNTYLNLLLISITNYTQITMKVTHCLINTRQVEMANKPVPVGITRIRPRFDGESPLWLGMGMGMGNTRNFQLGMEMGIYIYPPKYPSPLKLLNYL